MGMQCPEEPKKRKIDVEQILDYAKRKGYDSNCDITITRELRDIIEKEDELKRKASRAVGLATDGEKKPRMVKVGTGEYLVVSGLAGTLVCGGSHLLSTPLDVLKCRIQVDHKKFPDLQTAYRVTLKEEGIRGLARGWAPTLIGYGAQGFAKFGFYESFKKFISETVGPEHAYNYKMIIFAASAGLAEAVGDVALAPFEAAKIRTQTRPGTPAQMLKCLPAIARIEGTHGLFKGLPALWMRQIPYTVSKFVCYEYAVDFLHNLFKKPKAQCSKVEQLQISLLAGISAGVVSAICSHPPDVIVSQLYKNPESEFRDVCKQLGWRGIWTGLATRILMIGSIAACQLFVVDSVKLALHLERPPLPSMPESLKRKAEK
ncbi:unnamed protein product [Bursaphelenchus xylophilus]|uniref:(pine wood nematode) hypothetical protein n=1 Tax=Bursaphelenchus xylophilus TaxID=6326 RepID=A0A1I7RT26_BURXY|nr:unnamed protein product [Bursaphelenchus xylophilus]CAG9122658.1 unnamed protein product [Bursaphelenchus xylophilus]